MSKQHIAVISVGAFAPGQVVTGLTDERIQELLNAGALIEGDDAAVPEVQETAEKPKARGK